MRKLVIGGFIAVSIAAGSVAVAAVNPLGIAGAQNPPATQPPAADGQKGDHPRGRILSDTLKELVANGTISQSQSDAITDSLKKKFEENGGPHGRRGPGFGRGGDLLRDGLDSVAQAIGIDTATLKSELMSGKSIAEVAQAHGVDPQKVIDALVAKASAKIDEAVAAGKIPADRAAAMKAQLPEHVTNMVNGHPGDFRGRGHGGPMGKHDDDNEADEAPAPPTSDAPTTAPTAPPTTAAPTTVAPTTAAPTTAPPTTSASNTTGTGAN